MNCFAGVNPTLSGTLVDEVTLMSPTVENSEALVGAKGSEDVVCGLNDFDYMVGHWRVRHRRTDPGKDDWKTFSGTSSTRTIMGGAGNVEDNVLELPGGTYRAAAVRAFDRDTGLWSIWWLDGRYPGRRLDPPVKGRFENGVGLFHCDDVINGKPTRVRFTWTYSGPDSARWEQAFSEDGGCTWATNWIMDFERD